MTHEGRVPAFPAKVRLVPSTSHTLPARFGASCPMIKVAPAGACAGPRTRTETHILGLMGKRMCSPRYGIIPTTAHTPNARTDRPPQGHYILKCDGDCHAGLAPPPSPRRTRVQHLLEVLTPEARRAARILCERQTEGCTRGRKNTRLQGVGYPGGRPIIPQTRMPHRMAVNHKSARRSARRCWQGQVQESTPSPMASPVGGAICMKRASLQRSPTLVRERGTMSDGPVV